MAARTWVMTSLLFLVLAGPGSIAPSYASDFDSNDYRVRMSAALVLGRTKPPGARAELERALNDSHPAVRAAAAASLAKLADPAARPALQARLDREGDESVLAQLHLAMKALDAEASAKARYVVQLGSIKNMTNVRGSELGLVMRTTTKTNATRFAPVVEGDDAAGLKGSEKKVPVLRLDGQLQTLSQATKDGRRTVRAQVEFSIVRMPGRTLKGTLSGAATSRDTGDRTLAALQDQAVQGAVESALANADVGFLAAAE
ncbi:MAG: HEAT repeat domain-containing protein [Polyangiaceae bacterium]|nr:HEAT repeat domain-containing protein [Polyangiaceae bacterium]